MPDPERAAEFAARSGEMRPYTGEAAVCPKCLFSGAGTEWLHRDYTEPGHCIPECLARACHCCGFTWYEAVASDRDHALTADDATVFGVVRY